MHLTPKDYFHHTLEHIQNIEMELTTGGLL